MGMFCLFLRTFLISRIVDGFQLISVLHVYYEDCQGNLNILMSFEVFLNLRNIQIQINKFLKLKN